MIKKLRARICSFGLGLVLNVGFGRKPDKTIGGADRPYLLRWYLIPRNKVFNIYLHEFHRSDDDRALHSHPWVFNLSVLLVGRYTEHCRRGAVLRQEGDFKLRWGKAFHRIELTHGRCWTLFITGPVVRTWGFRCPKGFVPHYDFTKELPGGVSEIGAGCGDFA